MSSPLGRDIFSIAKLQILFAGTGFLTQIFLARHLGPEQKGLFDLFLLIPTVLASVIDLGLLSANTYFAGKQKISIHVLHSHSFLWSLVSIVTLCLIFFGVQSTLQSLFPTLTGTQLFLSLLLAGPLMYFSLWSALMYGVDRVRVVYRFNVAVSAITLACYVFLAFVLHLNLSALLYATAGLSILKAAVALFALENTRPWKFTIDLRALKMSLTYGIALYLGLIINTLHFRVDQFMVNSMLGPAELGIYALAVRIAEMVWLLDYAIINASIFRVTASSPEDAARITQRVARLLGTMVLISSILLSLAAPIFLPLVFGDDFSPAVIPLLLLFPGILAWSLARVLAQFVAYQSGKPWLNFKASAIAFLINIVLVILFIPLWGIAGAAIASSISYFVNFALLAGMFKRLSGSTFKSILIPTHEDFALLKNFASEQLAVYARKS
ncbi:MAG: oligosaccharide flippase family protein [Bacteroidota bacterium]